VSAYPLNGRLFQIREEEITWAGECPWTGGFCFGTVDGGIFYYKEAAGRGDVEPHQLAVAEEAINGVAFWKDFVGVSTRSEVSLYRLRSSGEDVELVTGVPRGAHGILSTPGGQFLAPLGVDGMLCIDAERAPQFKPWIDHARQSQLYYYHLIYLGDSADHQILACAARTEGLLRIPFDKDKPGDRIIGFTSSDIDLIDVCALSSPEAPFAVAGLSLDRSLIFVRNILEDAEPRRLRFEEIRGTPYGILRADGHLFVLTSEELVVLPGLAARFLNGEPMDHQVHGRRTPIQAVDAYLVREKYLMIVLDDGVSILEIPELLSSGTTERFGAENQDGLDWSDVEGFPQLISMPWQNCVT
jgi:hypothetical protein